MRFTYGWTNICIDGICSDKYFGIIWYLIKSGHKDITCDKKSTNWASSVTTTTKVNFKTNGCLGRKFQYFWNTSSTIIMQNSHVNLNWSSELKMSNPPLFFTYMTGIWHIFNNKIEKLTQISTAMEIYEGHKSNFDKVMENSKFFLSLLKHSGHHR